MARPNRSDVHLPLEEAARRAEEAHEYFEGLLPKRHTKPSRSEYSASYADTLQPSDRDFIPELDKLRDLEAHPQKLVYNGSEVVEEYVETEYYKDLGGIDKQHHTPLDGFYMIGFSSKCSPSLGLNGCFQQASLSLATGTGFILTEKSNGSSIDVSPVSDASVCPVSCKGNPATNEWIPSADTVIPVSQKPNRSEG